MTVKSLPPDMPSSITIRPRPHLNAYPISTFTYALVPRAVVEASTLEPFLNYAIGDGQALGKQYVFAPLPPVSLSRQSKNTDRQVHSL